MVSNYSPNEIRGDIMKCPKCNKFEFIWVDDGSGTYVSSDGSVVSLTIKCTGCDYHIVNDYYQNFTIDQYQPETKE